MSEALKSPAVGLCVLGISLSALLAALVPMVPIQLGPQLFATMSLALVGFLCFLAVFVGNASRAIFSPAGLPFQYISLSLVIPAFYAAVFGFNADYLPEYLTSQVFGIFLLFILGVALFAIRPARWEDAIIEKPEVAPKQPSARFIGVLLIVIAMAYRIYFLRTFGTGSFAEVRGTDLSFKSQLEVFANLFPILGILLILLADHKPRALVVGTWPCLFLGIWAGVSLLIGTRGEVIAPALILLWAYNYRVRSLRLRVAAPLLLLGVFVLGAVGVWRQGQSLDSASGFFLRPMVSPTNVTSQLLKVVPYRSDYLHGETYLDSLRYSVPGFMPTEVSDLSASFRFPHLISYDAPTGLGFAIPTEAYWNFGPAGVLVVGIVLGWLLSWSYRHARAWPTSALHLFYPLVIAQIPVLLRADFLAFYKATVYVIVIVAFLHLIERGLANDSR